MGSSDFTLYIIDTHTSISLFYFHPIGTLTISISTYLMIYGPHTPARIKHISTFMIKLWLKRKLQEINGPSSGLKMENVSRRKCVKINKLIN